MNRIISIILFIFVTSNAFRLKDPVTLKKIYGLEASYGKYQWEENYIKVPLDHFSFTDDTEFDLRYFINTTYYKQGGPILFYTGNEGKLESFAENTGFMWDLAPELNAAVVFVEHRYYGKSQPFKNESYTSIKNLGYLSSQQALADFAQAVQYFKNEKIPGAQNSAVIAFGGSYGGMLSAWFRIKYPHLVDGAIAASAPVFWFVDSNIPQDAYDFVVTRAFLDAGCNRTSIENGWKSLDKLASNEEGKKYLNTLFKLDPKSLIIKDEDILFLKQYIRESMEAMAMVNYPYPTSFLSKLPGWPVKEACKFAKNPAKSDEESAEQLYNIVNMYYNYTGDQKTHCANADKCGSAYDSLGDPLGWPFQTCTELAMPLCGSGGTNDFFWKDCPFTLKGWSTFCDKVFSKIGYNTTLLRPKAGGLAYGSNTLPSASNIVFSNGYLDPWSAGGWSKKNKVEGSAIGVILLEGAHHYDLRGAHPLDTEEVKKVRAMETTAIRKWIKEKKLNIKRMSIQF